MSLDVKLLAVLDEHAKASVNGDKLHDGVALDIINNLPVAKERPYLRSEYMKYYFKSKQSLRDERDHHAVHYKWWRGC